MQKKSLGIARYIPLLAGCATVPTKDIQIDAQADPRANFNGYQTYAWLGAAAIVNDPYGQWEPPAFDADAEIEFLIDRELHRRGMSENTTDPDLVVAYAVGTDMEVLGLKVDPGTKMELVDKMPQGPTGLCRNAIVRQAAQIMER